MLLTITFRIPTDVANRLTTVPYKGREGTREILDVMVREIVYSNLGIAFDPDKELTKRGTV